MSGIKVQSWCGVGPPCDWGDDEACDVCVVAAEFVRGTKRIEELKAEIDKLGKEKLKAAADWLSSEGQWMEIAAKHEAELAHTKRHANEDREAWFKKCAGLQSKLAHLKYELAAADYPGKSDLVRENQRLRKALGRIAEGTWTGIDGVDGIARAALTDDPGPVEFDNPVSRRKKARHTGEAPDPNTGETFYRPEDFHP